MTDLVNLLDPFFIIKAVGLIGVFAVIFAETGLFFGFFFPGDSLLFAVGLFSSQGFGDVQLVALGCFIAAVLGDSFGYAFGRKIGPAIFTKEDSFLFKKSYVEKSKLFYEKHGKKTIILARFIPVVRTFAPILAGVGKMEYKAFLFFNVLGGALWVFLMVFGGYFLGEMIPGVDQYILPIVVLIVLTSFAPALKNLIKRK